VAFLDDPDTRVSLSNEVETYWKRWFEYSCTNRTIPFHEISYIVKGDIYGTIGGETISLGAGGMFWMSPNVRHSLTWPRNLIYYTFRFTLKRRDEDLVLDQPSVVLPNAAPLEMLCGNLALVLKEDPSNGLRERQIRAYLLLIAAHAATHQEREAAPLSYREFSAAEKAELLEFCLRNRFVTVDSTSLADHLGFSRDYFSRVFKRTYGMSARTWMFRERMLFAARQLLETESAVAEIAERIGYVDPYVFSREFKRVVGASPKKYRERNRWVSLASE
jgi:AraC-like DNA-binding protein